MKIFCTILISIVLLLPEKIEAQNYFYVNGDISYSVKINIVSQIEYTATLFDFQDVTIAVFKCELPRKYNATIEYHPNQRNNRKMILIRLSNRLAVKDYILTISHEMIHAYQYYIGDLIRHARTNFTWRGVNFRNVHQVEHSKRPWEIEAIDQSEALTTSYLDFQNKFNILSKVPSFEVSTFRK